MCVGIGPTGTMLEVPYLVFVSHASVDTWVARQIARHIEVAPGGAVFLDAVDIEKGDDYDERIRHAVNACRELVVLMTPAANESKNVWMEVGAMWGRGERIVGILYGITADEVRADPRMPQGFRKLQLVDINDTDTYLAQVAARIEKDGRT